MFLCGSGLWAGLTEAAAIKDSESATHGAEDALHQIVDTYRFPGFEIIQFNLPVLSHYSYLLVSGKEALVVDPDRDINAYLDHAKKHGLTIKGVFLTHSHADFVAGHLEFVKALQIPVYQNSASGAKYKIEGLKDGSSFKVGTATVKVMETPGHTPDGMCGLVFSDGDAQPKAIFTGDTLFSGIHRQARSAGRQNDGGHSRFHELRYLAQQAFETAGCPCGAAGARGGVPVRGQPLRRSGLDHRPGEVIQSLHTAQGPQ